MNYEEQKRRGVFSLIAAACALILAIVFLGVAGDMKDSWEYHFDESCQNTVSMLNIVGWCAAIFAVVDFIQGLVFLCVKEDIPINSQLTTCKDCGHSVSKSAEMCPHCGRKNPGESGLITAERGCPPPAPVEEKIPAWKQVEMEKQAKEEKF